MALIRIGGEIVIPGDLSHPDYEVTGSSVAALPGGGWVTVWAESFEGKSTVWAQLFYASGASVGPAEQVNLTEIDSTTVHPVVTVLNDGTWVVTWAVVSGTDQERDSIRQGHFAGIMPPQLSLGGAPIAEAAATGTFIGELSLANVTDVQTGSLRYQLLDDAGGRFVLEGKQLKVRDGLKLDYEQAASHTITIQVTGSSGFSHTQTLTVQVGDVARENVTGNDGGHYLLGGASVDIFFGMGGNDTLGGGDGKDILTGGTGRDVFLFNTKPNKKTNVDTIKDFRAKDDSIWLDDAVFKGLGKAGTMTKPAKMAAKAFYSGSKAHDVDDRIIFDKSKGALYYDPDGTGAKAQILIAKMPKKALGIADFFVI